VATAAIAKGIAKPAARDPAGHEDRSGGGDEADHGRQRQQQERRGQDASRSKRVGGHPAGQQRSGAEDADQRGQGGKARLGSNRRLHVDDEWRGDLRIHARCGQCQGRRSKRPP
jgi:hypothetical protein